MIVAIEGIDASGKETQVRKLKAWALEHKEEMALNDVAQQDFPDYLTPAGIQIQGLLTGKWSIVANELGSKEFTKALVLQSLMVTNRLERGALLKRFDGNPWNLLILDRYYASGMVYGRSDGLKAEWLDEIHDLLPVADLFILVDVSVDESVRRRPERRDYYEKNLPKLEEIRKGYLELFAGKGPDWITVDGIGTVEDVHSRIVQPVRDWLKAR